jgi:ABC-type sugar transport system ATPase subunit
LLLNFLREAIRENSNISFTLITHHINEVIEFCDRVTVLRDGQAVATLNVPETDNRELAAFIVGDFEKSSIRNGDRSSPSNGDPNARVSNEETLLKIDGLTRKGRFSNINFRVEKGQVIGLAGLDGSGKHEFLEGLTGLSPVDSGHIRLRESVVKIGSPVDALSRGIAYLPRKREEQAIIHNRSVQDNILISIYQKISNRLGLIDAGKSREIATSGIKALNVKTPGLSTNIDYLSGGNRQKVVLNRIDNTKPLIYILNEPTRGVDMATKPEILHTIRHRFTTESAVIFTSESEEELIEASDVIYVFYKGEIKKTFCRNQPDFTVSEVYKAVQGVGLE